MLPQSIKKPPSNLFLETQLATAQDGRRDERETCEVKLPPTRSATRARDYSSKSTGQGAALTAEETPRTLPARITLPLWHPQSLPPSVAVKSGRRAAQRAEMLTRTTLAEVNGNEHWHTFNAHFITSFTAVLNWEFILGSSTVWCGHKVLLH